MKKWLPRILLLVGYCVPYAFLAMNGDAAQDTVLYYAVWLAVFTLLCRCAVRTHNRILILIGNVLSALTSSFFLLSRATEKWQWYFKPFSALGLFLCLTILALGVQLAYAYLPRWNRAK